MTSLSPATIGEEMPLGTATFHFTFFAGPNSTGGFCPFAIPEPFGPRNCGQPDGTSPASPMAAKKARATNVSNVLMSFSSVKGSWFFANRTNSRARVTVELATVPHVSPRRKRGILVNPSLALFGVGLFMECGDVTPLLFLCFSCFFLFFFCVRCHAKQRNKAVLHHRTP